MKASDHKTKITVFQALTLLASEYKNSNNDIIYKDVIDLYLSGVRSPNDEKKLNNLLQNKILKNYFISDDPHDINEDPTRRYFESNLALFTINNSIDALDAQILKQYFDDIFKPFDTKTQEQIKNYMQDEKFLEYQQPVAEINKSKDTFLSEFGSQERKNKISLILQIVHRTCATIEKQGSLFPPDLYSAPNSVFDPQNRGRKARTEKLMGTQDVKSNAMGIMRNYMPLSQDDTLLKEKSSTLVRPVDGNTFVLGAQQSEETFKQKVTPFVNSISGNMLMMCRVLAKCIKDNNFVYKNHPDQLKLLFKNYISVMSYNAGGHSMEEFMRTFKLPEIQEVLKDIPEFKTFNLETLFKQDNETAFNQALKKTIEYNTQIIKRQNVHNELKTRIIKENQDIETVGVKKDYTTKTKLRESAKKIFDIKSTEKYFNLQSQNTLDDSKSTTETTYGKYLKIEDNTLKHRRNQKNGKNL